MKHQAMREMSVEPLRQEGPILSRMDRLCEKATGLPIHSVVQILRSRSRLRNGLSKALSRRAAPCLVRVDQRADLTGLSALGDGEGQWRVPTLALRSGGIAYCIGAGFNVSLDIALARSFGMRVFTFDPTPESVNYMRRVDYPHEHMTFVQLGVWAEDTQLRFFAPNEHAVNFSVLDLHNTAEYVVAPVRRLSTIARELQHSEVDFIKLDVEGSWWPIITDMIATFPLPRVLCVEFDSPTSIRKIVKAVRTLEAAGMRLVDFHKEEYAFVRSDILDRLAR